MADGEELLSKRNEPVEQAPEMISFLDRQVDAELLHYGREILDCDHTPGT